jgi:GNAT superfamily N-acetyltransferase
LSRTFNGNAKTDPAVMRWQYWDNPFGGCVGMVIEDGGRIISHSTAFCVDAQMRGERTKITIGADGATDERFRRRGLSVRLWIGMIAELRKEGVVATFGFPGRHTANPRTLLNLAPPIPVRLFARPLRGVLRPAARSLRREGEGDGREIDVVPSDIDSLWERVSPSLPFSVVKNRTWWTWRFDRHPQRPYRLFEVREDGNLTAVAATRERTSRGRAVECIVELLAVDDGAARTVVGAVARATGANGLAFKAPVHAPQARWARAGGLRLVPRRLEPDAMNLLAQFYDKPSLVNEPWSVTWADTDYI